MEAPSPDSHNTPITTDAGGTQPLITNVQLCHTYTLWQAAKWESSDSRAFTVVQHAVPWHAYTTSVLFSPLPNGYHYCCGESALLSVTAGGTAVYESPGNGTTSWTSDWLKAPCQRCSARVFTAAAVTITWSHKLLLGDTYQTFTTSCYDCHILALDFPHYIKCISLPTP